jgi:hypothetical protein
VDGRVAVSIDAKEARRIVLLQANEGYSGLYAIIWELSTVHAGSTLGERYAAAEQAVRELIERGWISLYRSRAHPEDIDPATVAEVLSNPVSWYPEYAGVRIVFAATEEGKRAYASGALEGD